jgi:hypothetical protein
MKRDLPPILALTAVVLAGNATGQQLRRAVASADVVAVAQHVGVRVHGKDALIHKLRVLEVLAGEPGEEVAVVEWRALALHQRPQPGERRLYCLHRLDAARADLPAGGAPYYKMSGHPGSNPAVADNDSPALQLARAVLGAARGANPRDTAARLVQLALRGPAGTVRTEAVELLAEREALRDGVDPLQTSDLVARAIGESEDVPFKIALAELAGALRVPQLVDSLCLAIDSVADESFARAVGRIARHLHGEGAHDALWPHIERARNEPRRAALLIAVGATSTEAALEALLRLRERDGPSAPVDAALRLHGSPRALQVLDARGKKDDGR